jgi:hypothetical protein
MGTADFGGGALTSAGSYDIFLAKFWRAAPIIHAVRDVPGDQGGLVNVAWDASGCDTPVEHVITRYTVWRAIDPSLVSELLAGGTPLVTGASDANAWESGTPFLRAEQLGATTYYWYLVASFAAYYLPGYSAPVATLFDWTEDTQEYHYFQIIAHTSTPYAFYTSDPDSGYSVDNLAPSPPLALIGDAVDDDAALTWNESGGYVEDLSHYAVYRSDVPGFTPGPGNFLDTSPDTTYLDTTTGGESFYYKVTALDTHGNESSPSNEVFVEILTGIDDVAAPKVFTILPNTPNPFATRTTLRFGLATKSDVTIEVFDVAGRRVFADRLSGLPTGWRSYSFDGRDHEGELLSSGVYFFRVKTAAGTSTKKMVIAR